MTANDCGDYVKIKFIQSSEGQLVASELIFRTRMNTQHTARGQIKTSTMLDGEWRFVLISSWIAVYSDRVRLGFLNEFDNENLCASSIRHLICFFREIVILLWRKSALIN